ncbi:hypothetical protein GCM10023322_24320 [Rugosimonospora acidiphila]|uniref:Uncharacterized protein n=1 Tax=Rugosimonospora acidiphila TaxID=556531 RepID=A0ABP9RPW7_9ACTN
MWPDTEGDQADPRAPRRPGWGCLAAMIVVGIGLIVVVVIAVNVAGTAFSGVRIR